MHYNVKGLAIVSVVCAMHQQKCCMHMRPGSMLRDGLWSYASLCFAISIWGHSPVQTMLAQHVADCVAPNSGMHLGARLQQLCFLSHGRLLSSTDNASAASLLQ